VIFRRRLPRIVVICFSSSCRVAIVAMGVLVCAAGVAAQDLPAGSSQQAGDEAYRTTLLLGSTLDVGHGADPSGTDETTGADGLYTGGQFTLSFGKRLRRVAFGASAAKSVRLYRDGGVIDLGDSAGVTFDAQLRRSRFTVGQTIRRMPFQQLLQFGDIAAEGLAQALTSPDMAVLSAQTTTVATVAGFSRPLGRRAELQLHYGFDESRLGSRVDRRVFTFGGGIRRSLTRALDLRLGHTLRLVRSEQQSVTPSLTAHDLDLGVDYRKALSFSRRTSLTFSSGAAAISTEGITQYLATGAAGLQHRIGRSWTASATFDRRLQVLEGISQPVVANGLTTTVGGMFGRRAGMRVRGSMMEGRLGVPVAATTETTAPGLGTITTFKTEARVLYTLWRGWQWYAEHFYYQHDLSNPALLSTGVPASLTRSGVRTGVELQMALLRRRR
jgi:hypothetical protein